MLKKLISLLLCSLLLMGGVTGIALAQPDSQASPSAQASASPTPLPEFQNLSQGSITAPCAILIDTASGKVLFSKNADTKCYPASITKIMTCILALKNGDLAEEIKVSNIVNTIEAGSSNCGLRPGETLTLEQLLYGLMLNSGNDAAAVIAEHFGGSIEGFADMMNAYAAEIGMTNSHFVNPHGLHDDNHYTTPADMAKLARVGMSIPKFREIVSTRISELPTNEVVSDERPLVNGNKLIDPNSPYYYEYAIGVKTGYTTKANHTLVASASKDGVEVIAVVMNDEKEGKWKGMKTMFDYAFKYYGALDLQELYAQSPLSFVPENADTSDGSEGRVQLKLVPDESTSTVIVDTKQNIAQLQNDPTALVLEPENDLATIKAPITEGQQITRYTYFKGGDPVSVGTLVAENAVNEEQTALPSLPDLTQEDGKPSYLTYALIALAVILLIILILRIRKARRFRRKNRRKRVVVYRRKKR
ncbi:D-alanyl-D-alanine carboxypeptidase [Christensenellaceae bacterium NSJ-44]|uniref:D-alanyl-D-alanine carboxypeptidase n=1 Tax=Luoshenia tenuis TaxID=2763654 RepID=A0A926HJQ2_9FIRM|nr:D-alanyl-D-alanine carboxypeptidase family protein [Luoshenia tenuis]MBC8530132.1 D-alanyl-D-alanine carboxypeptidase [Luoshenia tenuis]